MSVEFTVLLALLGAGIGAVLAFAFLMAQGQFLVATAKKRAEELLAQAQRDADTYGKQALLDAKEEALKDREKLLVEVEQKRGDLREWERGLERREQSLQHKREVIEKKERSLDNANRKAQETSELADKRRLQYERMLVEERDILYNLAGMDRTQAEKLLLSRLETEMADEMGTRVLQFDALLKNECEQRAREILATAIQRYAAEYTAETTCSTIDIPNDDMKGRIIGRDGRNIRAFEKSTGVDVIVDETPGIVVVSAFDNVRREIAKLSLQRLISDGRIHPSRIEEVVTQVKQEMDNHILDLGKRAALEADVHDLHEKLIRLLGRLKFRTSYSQNVLQHSLEVAHLCALLAEELGLDAALARRCGLLHDVGKAIDHEMEGGHPLIGADVAQRCGEQDIVLHAIACHHDAIRIDHVYTVLVATADAISASRPGARRETLEKYVKRMEDLETLAKSFPGIDSAYAVQAGREIRVIADAQKTTDLTAAKLCRDIANAIEKRLSYPGEIKVTVIRESRAIEYAH